MNKKMLQNFNDSYTSAVTASTENHDQSFMSKSLENTNDILLINFNEFSFDKTYKKGNSKKTLKKNYQKKRFFFRSLLYSKKTI